uniref:Anther-specific protein BCP1 n=1 Tax=Leersia perrieri TaxID=77586 RepID=A0A0D9W1B1_9ORYZ
MAAGHRTLLLLVAVLFAAITVALADEAKPTILTPVADTPLGSFDGETPDADDAMDDDDAAPVGAPIGTTMTEPQPELTTTPGGAGASAGSSLGVAAHIGAVVAAAVTGVYAF